LTPLLVLLSLHPSITQTRHATHAAEGRAKTTARGSGKRLGAKKSASELVVPGNIIFRQRGTHWFPGENCGMGRDHTIFAREKGFVVFYKDPERHATRKFIGVVFERGQRLPVPRGAARRRRLGMVAAERDMGTLAVVPDDGDEVVQEVMEGNDNTLIETEPTKPPTEPLQTILPQKPALQVKSGYMYRETNWQIGRAAEKAKVKVRAYEPGDRFMAWRKANARKADDVKKNLLRVKKKGAK
jgi:large subunit ribosomal protein L27